MSNTSLGMGVKGSKLCMQLCVNNPSLKKKLDEDIGLGPIDWISPLKNDKFKEYQINHLSKIIHYNKLKEDLNRINWENYWPKRQPQWDAIGYSPEKKQLLIVEAKAHVAEIKSRCSASSVKSRAMIKNAITYTFGKKHDINPLLNKYYQIANRFVFLNILKQHGINVRLIFIYFVNDKTYKPTKLGDYEKAEENFIKQVRIPDSLKQSYKIIHFKIY